MRPSRFATYIVVVTLCIVAGLSGVLFEPKNANAVNALDFQAGNIVSDANFYNRSAMTEAQIQAFLSSKVGSCSNSNCLANYVQDTPTRTWSWGTCSTYIGGLNESAARIIFKVQQACGISAKVLLVTLQKEQGLITNDAPSDAIMRKAMGFACPDTSECDSAFYGFFNQIFAAARQLAWYNNPAGSFTTIRVGQSNNIRYNPNSGCGAQSVYIANKATAALYYYTPYTPNAAALNAQWSASSDSCASYGNRNFFLNWSNWFGNPLIAGPEADIEAVAASYPSLGAKQGGLTCGLVSGGCRQQYANGIVLWTPSIGARKLDGGIRDLWISSGSEVGYLGYPVTDAVWYNQDSGGWYQAFENGAIHWSNPGGGRIISSAIYAQYLAQGGINSGLGWALSSQVVSNGIARQDFQTGSVFWTAEYGSKTVRGGIWETFTSLAAVQASSLLGAPKGNAVFVSGSGGWTQEFRLGDIYWRNGAGRVLYGGIRLQYIAQGGLASLGWPSSAQNCGLVNGGCRQDFQFGSILWSSGTGAVRVDGGLLIGYDSLGAQSGALGYPLAGAVRFSNNGGGWGQPFQNGGLYWTPQFGAVSVTGGILQEYNRQGGHTSTLGWPRSEAVCGLVNGGCRQDFQFGSILWSSGTGAVRVDGGLLEGWISLGAESGTLGYPVSGATTRSAGGWSQQFERGRLAWNNGSSFLE